MNGHFREISQLSRFSASGKSKLDSSEIPFMATRLTKNNFNNTELERMGIYGVNINCYKNFGEHLAIILHGLISQASLLIYTQKAFLHICNRKQAQECSQKNFCGNKKIATNQMPSNRKTDKYVVVYSQWCITQQ